MSQKILIIDDEEDIVTLVKYNLEQEGYTVHFQYDGKNAIQTITSLKPDLIILDIMIPYGDGFELCKEIRATYGIDTIPILLVTAKTQDHSIITGLEIGANDYITKPFSIHILIARVRSQLRQDSRSTSSDASIIKYNSLELNANTFQLKLDNEDVFLSASEFKLLQTLLKKPGRVYSRDQLIELTKGENYYITDRAIDVLMVSLRKKLKHYASSIKTVRGLGYRFEKVS